MPGTQPTLNRGGEDVASNNNLTPTWRPLPALPPAQAQHPETGRQSQENIQRISPPETHQSKGPRPSAPSPSRGHTRPLTAEGPSRSPGSGWCLRRISLHWAPKHQLQLLGVWGRDGIPPHRHLNQRQPHAPDVRLHRVVGPLESFRLHERQTQF